jgi:lipoyl(octanoyl) transferase
MIVRDLGTLPYNDAWKLQEEHHARVAEGGQEVILLVEHPPVVTLGRRATAMENLLASSDLLQQRGVELVQTDRGGDITFHGPGQIVAYPIVELKERLDLRRYVRTLEAAIIETAAAFGVEGGRVEGHPGIWVDGERKLAAIGVRVKRGVTTHGLALNVNTDLRWFDEMIPCGIHGKGVTSLARELGGHVPMDTVEDELARQLAAHLGLRLADGNASLVGPGGGREQ